ncbi:flagellar basal body-associated FliL family protein [Azospirillum agricola]|uniref:flagellar basal body-associated FliL family protein n=1 Tax=Azospirillum agricola TaxID=1720247 RepID=UPI000A0EF10E|nr:flagellar basal body-associated FliL family protein [Azospirillum agricola]SMH58521.1 Flagellar basal body-associated protein FliL [Azospirillum lipoferum]
MRLVHRNRNGETVSLMPFVLTGLILALGGLGAAGAVLASKNRSPVPAASEKAKPAKHYAALPQMTFTLGGGDARLIDVKVLLEIDPSVDGKVADPYVPRIADQLSDRLRQIDPQQLSGAEGARLMKSTIGSVLDRELRGVRIREVLLDRMVVR